MITTIFNQTALVLVKAAQKLNLTYNEVNIIVYYMIVPLTWCIMLDLGSYFQQLAVDVSRVDGIVCSGHLVASQGFQHMVRLGISEVGQFLVMVPSHRLGLLQGIGHHLRGVANHCLQYSNIFIINTMKKIEIEIPEGKEEVDWEPEGCRL